jgi:hypothetical protein
MLDVLGALLAHGGRAPGSVAEAQAAAEVNGRLRRAGLQVVTEPFRYLPQRDPHAPWLGLAAVALSLLALREPLPSALALIGLLLADAVLLRWPLRQPLRESQNVIGTRAARGARRWRLILLAPLDSPPQLSPFGRAFAAPAASERPRRLMLLATLALLALLAALAGPVWAYLALPLAALLGLAAVATLLRVRAPASPGALSYATSAAALVAAAEQLRELRQVELWVAAVGATTADDSGTRDFFARYPFEPDQTLLLGIEGVGAGRLTCVTREGARGQARADALLLRLAASADAAAPAIDMEPRPYHAAPTLLTPLLRRWRGLTIATLDLRGRVPLRSSARDTLDQVDQQLLDRTLRLVVGIARQLDGLEQG